MFSSILRRAKIKSEFQHKTTCNHKWWQWNDWIASLFSFFCNIRVFCKKHRYFYSTITLDANNMLMNFVRFVTFEINMLLVFTHVTFLFGRWVVFVMTSLSVFFIRRADGVHFALRGKKKLFTVLVGPYIEKCLPSVTFLRPRGNIFIYVFYMNIFI